MKTWMKVLMWFGLGAGIGFFAGWQVGERQNARKAEEADEDAYAAVTSSIESAQAAFDQLAESSDAFHKKVNDMLGTYRGDIDGDETPSIVQLHPTYIRPVQITEDEFNYNENGYDLHDMVWYEGDEVLYDETKQEIIPEPESEIGLGMLDAFGGDPRRAVNVIYVKNETFGKLYRVVKSPEAFNEEVDGTAPGPSEYDDDEDAEMPDMDELGIDEEEVSEDDLD